MDLKELLTLITNVNNWTIDSILSFLSIIIAIVGGIFAYKQWRYSNKTKRADFINQIISKLRFDKEMAETMNVIDYGNEWYNDKFHNQNNGLEKRMDNLLSYLSYICYLKKEKHIGKREFCIFEYEVNRVCSSPSVKCYLWNLYHFSSKQKANCSFQYLIDYGMKNKLIDKREFLKSESNVYGKKLNF
ncbi:MAG: hypothetical protein HDT46_10610 [Ruminococcaceae bacterium]|nr:hypothetical protein [Oscillospiraceae bacterium]